MFINIYVIDVTVLHKCFHSQNMVTLLLKLIFHCYSWIRMSCCISCSFKVCSSVNWRIWFRYCRWAENCFTPRTSFNVLIRSDLPAFIYVSFWSKEINLFCGTRIFISIHKHLQQSKRFMYNITIKKKKSQNLLLENNTVRINWLRSLGWSCF